MATVAVFVRLRADHIASAVVVNAALPHDRPADAAHETFNRLARLGKKCRLAVIEVCATGELRLGLGGASMAKVASDVLGATEELLELRV